MSIHLAHCDTFHWTLKVLVICKQIVCCYLVSEQALHFIWSVSLVELPLKNYISGYQEGEYAGKSLLWHSAEQSRWNRQTFQRCVLPSSSAWSTVTVTDDLWSVGLFWQRRHRRLSSVLLQVSPRELALHMVTENDMQSALQVLFTFLHILRSTTAKHLPHSTLFHPARGTPSRPVRTVSRNQHWASKFHKRRTISWPAGKCYLLKKDSWRDV
jgi:hypothetical protein